MSACSVQFCQLVNRDSKQSISSGSFGAVPVDKNASGTTLVRLGDMNVGLIARCFRLEQHNSLTQLEEMAARTRPRLIVSGVILGPVIKGYLGHAPLR